MAKYTVVVHLVKTFQVLYSVHCILLTLLMLHNTEVFFTGKKTSKLTGKKTGKK